VAKSTIAELSQTIDNDVLLLLCLAWQIQQSSIKLKYQPKRTKALLRKEHNILQVVK